MKKKYEIPEAEELRISLEMGLLTVTGSDDDDIIINPTMEDDGFND